MLHVIFCLVFVCVIVNIASSSVPHASFLPSNYKLSGDSSITFSVRQVPGDGACLFNAIAAVLRFEEIGQHGDFDADMYALSDKLRAVSVEALTRNNWLVVLEDGEEITTNQLLDVVARHYNTTHSEYCSNMRLKHTWGGGPEIVALSNVLEAHSCL